VSTQVLLIDDDRAFSALGRTALEREGCAVRLARSLQAARQALLENAPDVILLDRRLPDGDGLEMIAEIKAQHPGAVVILVTAHAEVAAAVEAIRAGASDYLVKPVELSDLIAKVRKSMTEIHLRDRLTQAEAELSGRFRLVPPTSPAMQRVLDALERIARRPRSPVLLLGETGVGKELLARQVHAWGTANEAPFVQINCAALPESTVESELFGNERGAFTDARTSRRGLVEVASGGTLFLDEIGELPLDIQAKLLTFLDSGHFRRLGGAIEQLSTARIIAATNRDLEGEIRRGRFREDLWFRLSVFKVDVPPLRQRREDIIPLAQSFLDALKRELGRRDVELSEGAKKRLLGYGFPGNVRELRNILERALVLEAGSPLELRTLQEGQGADLGQIGIREEFCVGDPIPAAEVEKRYARYVLERLGGRRSEAARVLGLSYPTFLKRLGE
jgi:DNA-binding NtrC family response regulator